MTSETGNMVRAARGTEKRASLRTSRKNQLPRENLGRRLTEQWFHNIERTAMIYSF